MMSLNIKILIFKYYFKYKYIFKAMCKKLISHSTAQFQCLEGYSYSVELSAATRTVITATTPGYTK